MQTDKQWLDDMNRCIKALNEYCKYKDIIEEEYERRFGHNPSDVDDDSWIDVFHYGPSPLQTEVDSHIQHAKDAQSLGGFLGDEVRE